MTAVDQPNSSTPFIAVIGPSSRQASTGITSRLVKKVKLQQERRIILSRHSLTGCLLLPLWGWSWDAGCGTAGGPPLWAVRSCSGHSRRNTP